MAYKHTPMQTINVGKTTQRKVVEACCSQLYLYLLHYLKMTVVLRHRVGEQIVDQTVWILKEKNCRKDCIVLRYS